MPEWLPNGSIQGLLGFLLGSLISVALLWTKKRARLPQALLLTALIAVILFAAWPFIISGWLEQTSKSPDQIQMLGQFGDMFGALTALLGAVTFLALLATIWYERSTNAEQRSANYKQSFETTYFQLMKMFQDSRPGPLIERMDHVDRRVVAQQIAEEMCLDSEHLGRLNEEERAMTLWSHYYSARYEANDDVLGPYFRGLYHWLKFIRESSPSAEEMRYANLARSQLSNSELILLAVNCLAYSGSGLTQFVCRYGLLKHLRDPDVRTAIRQVMERFYPPAAFGSANS